jgi:hypothetical protein
MLGIFVVSALIGFTGAAYAQTPDGEVPANEHVCDGLKADGITKALYGLCVAFCEAQDCVATFDPATNEVTFDPGCQPSSPKILDVYNRRMTASDPPMPCVNTVVGECPCWTAAELQAFKITWISNYFPKAWEPEPHYRAFFYGGRYDWFADVVWYPDERRGTCSYYSFPNNTPPLVSRWLELRNQREFDACYDSLIAEYTRRGFPGY